MLRGKRPHHRELRDGPLVRFPMDALVRVEWNPIITCTFSRVAEKEKLMPEGPEVETEKLHEAIQEEMEKEGSGFLKRIALTTAVLAAFAAVAALNAGGTVNEALLLKTESTRLQAQASDQWSYYQAKGLKAAVQEATAASWEAAGKP